MSDSLTASPAPLTAPVSSPATGSSDINEPIKPLSLNRSSTDPTSLARGLAPPNAASAPATPAALPPPTASTSDLPSVPRISEDFPLVLSPSTAAREATHEDATPHHHAAGYNFGDFFGIAHAHDKTHGTPRNASAALRHNAEAAAKRSETPTGTGSRPVVASPVMHAVKADFEHMPTTEIRAGLPQKPFYIHTELLVRRSPFFAAMQSTADNPQPPQRLAGPFFFPELDEFAFALFVQWIYTGELHGPTDFHSMNHAMCLYILARKFQMEKLENKVMDLVRNYYAEGDMTAPAFRLEYIYNNTMEACLMREVMVATAAYRAYAEAEKKSLSDSMRGVLSKGGSELAPDFAQALLEQVKNDQLDVRYGDPCRWHEHQRTNKCKKWEGFEPWSRR